MKNNQIPHVPFNGLIARVAIQCECPDTHVTGSFLFSGESHRSSCSRVSPVFDDLYELFSSVKKYGWAEAQDGNCAYGYIFNVDKGCTIENRVAEQHPNLI